MSNNSTFYNKILKLEESILKLWGTDEFHQIAKTSIDSADLDTHFHGLETMKDCLPFTKSVRQYYGPSNFGKMNMTLVNRQEFFILIMYMDSISTHIHDHPFDGAFKPFIKSPYEMNFDFKIDNEIEKGVFSGELKAQKIMQLSPLSATSISSDKIHMLVRPDFGHFSLLVAKVTTDGMNHSYIHPSLKFQHSSQSAYLSRIGQLIQMNPHFAQEIIPTLSLRDKLELQFNNAHIFGTKDNLLGAMKFGHETNTNWIAHEEFMTKIKTKIRMMP